MKRKFNASVTFLSSKLPKQSANLPNMYPHVPYSQPFIQPVCSEYNFSLTNEYPNIFVASKSNKYLPNEYIWIHLNIDNVKIKKKIKEWMFEYICCSKI